MSGSQRLERIGGCVLAGGLSSRMGRDKALLPFRRARLVDHAFSLLEQTGCVPVVVSGGYSDMAAVADNVPRSGPISGICSVMPLAETYKVAGWLFLPVDLPLIMADMLGLLCQQVSQGDAAHFVNQPLPLVLTDNERTRPQVTKTIMQLNAGECVSIREFLSELQCIECQLPPGQYKLLINVNTPAEWSAILEQSDKDEFHEFAH